MNFVGYIPMEQSPIGRQNALKKAQTRRDMSNKQKSILVLMEEILQQLIGSLSHYLQGFIHPRWCRISSIVHQQYFLKIPLVVIPIVQESNDP